MAIMIQHISIGAVWKQKTRLTSEQYENKRSLINVGAVWKQKNMINVGAVWKQTDFRDKQFVEACFVPVHGILSHKKGM